MKKGVIIMPYVSGRGGTETVVHNLFSSFTNNKNLKFELLSIGGTSDMGWLSGIDYKMKKISNSYKINESKLVRTLFYSSFLPLELYKYIKKRNPDFIISTNPFIWYLSKKIITILKLNIPIIAWYHYSLNEHPVKEKFLKSADYYLAISSGIKEQLIAKGINSNNIFLVYNPVSNINKIILRPSNTTKFIYVGRLMLDGQKNSRELFKALSQVKGKWTLDIFGGVHGDITNQDKILNYIKALGIYDRINWHGFVNDPWDKITTATSLILTSKFEGLPMVLCEAISCGIFCVSSDIETGPRDIITENNGKLYDLGNIAELASILQNIVDNPEKLPTNEEINKSSQKFSLMHYSQCIEKSILTILKQKES